MSQTARLEDHPVVKAFMATENPSRELTIDAITLRDANMNRTRESYFKDAERCSGLMNAKLRTVTGEVIHMVRDILADGSGTSVTIAEVCDDARENLDNFRTRAQSRYDELIGHITDDPRDFYNALTDSELIDIGW